MQRARGFIVGCANGWLWSPGRQSTPNSKLGELFICKKNILSAYYIRVTKWLVTRLQSNPIGTNFAGFGSNLKQFYWYKLRGLHVCKAIPLVQTSRAFVLNLKQFYWYKRRGLLFKLRRPLAFQLSRGLLPGAYWLAGSRSPDGAGNPTISRKLKPKSQPPASPSPGSPT